VSDDPYLTLIWREFWNDILALGDWPIFDMILTCRIWPHKSSIIAMLFWLIGRCSILPLKCALPAHHVVPAALSPTDASSRKGEAKVDFPLCIVQSSFFLHIGREYLLNDDSTEALSRTCNQYPNH
jgi:hypothetical protein